MPQHEVDLEHQIAGVVRRLAASLDGIVPEADVEVEVRRTFDEWADAPVREFVPIFAERQVRERLRHGQRRWPSSVS